MTVKEFILTYAEDEMLISFYDYNTEKRLSPFINMWKSSYIRIIPETQKYLYENIHEYDDRNIQLWEIVDNCFNIYI